MTRLNARKSAGRQLKHEAMATPTAHAAAYQPTSQEAAAACRVSDELDVKVPIPKLKFSDDGQQIIIHHPNETIGFALLMNATGASYPDFAKGLMCHIADVSLTNGERNKENVNFALSVVAGDQPADQDEAMFGVLKAASYLCAIKSAVHYQRAETRMEANTAETAFNKFARTCVILSEALMRKRSSSEQKVIVQNNVAVTDNGQAVIGNVNGPQTKTPAKEG